MFSRSGFQGHSDPYPYPSAIRLSAVFRQLPLDGRILQVQRQCWRLASVPRLRYATRVTIPHQEDRIGHATNEEVVNSEGSAPHVLEESLEVGLSKPCDRCECLQAEIDRLRTIIREIAFEAAYSVLGPKLSGMHFGMQCSS